MKGRAGLARGPVCTKVTNGAPWALDLGGAVGERAGQQAHVAFADDVETSVGDVAGQGRVGLRVGASFAISPGQRTVDVLRHVGGLPIGGRRRLHVTTTGTSPLLAHSGVDHEGPDL